MDRQSHDYFTSEYQNQGTAPGPDLPSAAPEAGVSDGAYAAGGAHFGESPSHVGKQTRKKKSLQMTKGGLAVLLILVMLLTTLLNLGLGSVLWKNQAATAPVAETSADQQATKYELASSDQTLSYKAIIEKTQDSVVSITTEAVATDFWAGNYVTQGAGSGVIIQPDGYILTCNHVIDGATRITVTLNDQTEYDAFLVGADPEHDLAVIKIDATGLSAATYGDSSKLTLGDQVVAIGNPLGELSGTATTGIISSLSRDLTIDGRTLNLLQTDASINPGNSGGALFDASGHLIGIVVAKSSGSDVEGLGFAIPINTSAKVAKGLIENGNTSAEEAGMSPASETPKIGISISVVSEMEAMMYDMDSGAGLYITGVSNPKAEAAGLQAGDKLVAVDGKKLRSFDELKAILGEHKVGDTVEVTILREGQTHNVKVELI